MSVLRIVTEIAAPVETCFDLSRSIDLHLESMVASKERAIAGVTSGLIGDGEEVTWAARHFGIPWRMTSRITAFDRPWRFVDEMTRGPFSFFRHEHVFEPQGETTRMVDVVEYRSWCWPLAPIADRVIGLYLGRLLRTRNHVIRSKAETV